MKVKFGHLSAAVLFVAALFSCSFDRVAVRAISDSLSSGGSSVFARDDDPELIADALPFTLKLYETLLERQPDNRELLLSTGSGYIMYANAFVETPALMLSDEAYEERQEMRMRAKKLYLRGREYLLRALETTYPGFREQLGAGKYREALGETTRQDVPLLYWTAAGWTAAFSIDTFDFNLSLSLPQAAALMARAYALEPDYGNGTIHEFYISYYGSLPDALGGDRQKAREHFRRAVELSEGLSPAPYLALATTVSIAEQNEAEFRELLGKALEIDPYADRDNTLANIISRRKAAWYLEHIGDFFLTAEPENEE